MKPGKVIGIVALVAVIVVAGYFVLFGGGDGGSTLPPDKIRNFRCVNEACAKTFAEDELNLDDAGPFGLYQRGIQFTAPNSAKASSLGSPGANVPSSMPSCSTRRTPRSN